MPMCCDRCGRPAKRTILQEGGREDWRGQLWCLECHQAEVHAGVNLDHHAVHGDEIPGGMTVENYGPKPIVFFTKSAMSEYRKRHGLILKESFCPFPGTDVDPQGIPNPEGYVDPQTMENRRNLALRAFGCKTEDTPGVYVNEVTFESDSVEEVRKYVGE